MGDPAGETVDQTAASVKSQGNMCTKGKKYGKLSVQEQLPQDSTQSREGKGDGHPPGESRSMQLAGKR